jgi:DNA-binding LytR/AlgR family response regulator
MKNLSEKITRLSFVICDDEVDGCDVIIHLLKEAGASDVTSFNDPVIALQYLSKNSVDIAFLDVKMPKLSGINLARRLESISTYFVFVTAYEEFATKAFDVDAIDYLTKPVSSERFNRCIKKLVDASYPTEQKLETVKPYQLLIKNKDNVIPIWNKEIKLIESADKYSVITTLTSSHIWRKPISKIETMLSPDIVRIHRSTMVATRWVERLEMVDNRWFILMLDQQRRPIGDKYKEQTLLAFESNQI